MGVREGVLGKVPSPERPGTSCRSVSRTQAQSRLSSLDTAWEHYWSYGRCAESAPALHRDRKVGPGCCPGGFCTQPFRRQGPCVVKPSGHSGLLSRPTYTAWKGGRMGCGRSLGTQEGRRTEPSVSALGKVATARASPSSLRHLLSPITILPKPSPPPTHRGA